MLDTPHANLDDIISLDLAFESLGELLLSPSEQAAAFGLSAQNEHDLRSLKAMLAHRLTPDLRLVIERIGNIGVAAHFAFGTDDFLREWLDSTCEQLGNATPRQYLVSCDPTRLSLLVTVVEERIDTTL